MPNTYLKGKIKNYELYKNITVGALIVFAYFAGRYFFFSGPLNIVVGMVLGVIGVAALLAIEYYVNKQTSYIKGLKLEEQIADKLDNLDVKYEPHIETNYGDLDFFIIKDNLYYGAEAKNWAGVVTFENGLLKVDGWNSTDILSALLRHCLLARNKKFGLDSNIFIHPVLVFGHKADIHISQNKIIFNNVEIIVATIKDFDRYIK